MRRKIKHIIFFIVITSPHAFAQIVVPFAVKYQKSQRGDIVFVANTSMGCAGAAACAANINEIGRAHV